MIVAATGHRPHKLGGYGEDVFARLTRYAMHGLKALEPYHVISGMALGWDQAVAMAAVQLSIPFTAACPFEDMHAKWPRQHWPRFLWLHEQAQHVEYVSPGAYAPWKMQARNVWMVNKATRMLALWDGSAGGTENCLDHALLMGVPMDNAWPGWVALHA